MGERHHGRHSVQHDGHAGRHRAPDQGRRRPPPEVPAADVRERMIPGLWGAAGALAAGALAMVLTGHHLVGTDVFVPPDAEGPSGSLQWGDDDRRGPAAGRAGAGATGGLGDSWVGPVVEAASFSSVAPAMASADGPATGVVPAAVQGSAAGAAPATAAPGGSGGSGGPVPPGAGAPAPDGGTGTTPPPTPSGPGGGAPAGPPPGSPSGPSTPSPDPAPGGEPAPGPVETVTEPIERVVVPVVAPVREVVEPVVAPVREVVEPVVAPVRETVAPVARAVEPATEALPGPADLPAPTASLPLGLGGQAGGGS